MLIDVFKLVEHRFGVLGCVSRSSGHSRRRLPTMAVVVARLYSRVDWELRGVGMEMVGEFGRDYPKVGGMRLVGLLKSGVGNMELVEYLAKVEVSEGGRLSGENNDRSLQSFLKGRLSFFLSRVEVEVDAWGTDGGRSFRFC